jgi:hypothetical protein
MKSHGAERGPRWLRITILGAVVLLFLGAATALYIRLPHETRYIQPRNGDDWGAWAGWFAAIVTTTALVYTARAFRQDARAQRELRTDRDEEARRLARKLSITFNALTGEGTWGSPITGVAIRITNNSEQSFTNLTVYLPDFGGSIKTQWRSSIPAIDDPLYAPDEPEWQDVEGSPVSLPGDKLQWLIGDIQARYTHRVWLSFDVPQPHEDWEINHEMVNGRQTESRVARVAVAYTDSAGRTWTKWSNMSDGSLVRMWPDWPIVP